MCEYKVFNEWGWENIICVYVNPVFDNQFSQPLTAVLKIITFNNASFILNIFVMYS
jgi:hypothetical protein